MKLSQFKFDLPIEQIAQQPAEYRDEARMMVLHRKSGEIEHRLVKDLIEYLDEDDVLVLNNTRVFPARMYATKEKTNAHIEVFLLRELNHKFRYWDVLVDPARKIRIGNKLYFAGDDSIVAEVIDNTTSRGRTLRFLTDYPEEEFMEHLYQLGETPLPRYISRDWSNTEEDEEKRIERDKEIAEGRAADARNYQAIDEIATEIGAVAAPASCLHFSRILLKRLEIQGVDIQMMTSHVGLGNFKPVDVEDLTKHKVDSEEYFIPEELSQAIDRAHAANRRICVVGTETMRAIESVVGTMGQVPAKHGWTNKFIFPPYDFTVADANFVNFYLPESSQLMQVAAFAGYDHMMHAYEVAVQEGYRFGDFGDAMLIID